MVIKLDLGGEFGKGMKGRDEVIQTVKGEYSWKSGSEVRTEEMKKRGRLDTNLVRALTEQV